MVFRKLLACKTDTASRFCIRAQRRNESLQLFLPAANLGKHSRFSEVGIVFVLVVPRNRAHLIKK
jgi:hypothetical protein